MWLKGRSGVWEEYNGFVDDLEVEVVGCVFED